jgi:cyclase
MTKTGSGNGLDGQQSSAGNNADTNQTFPVGGLVDLSRVAYQSAPLTVTQICPEVFAFAAAGGTVTAVRGSQGCAMIDTGYGPRVDEIRRRIADAVRQSPTWLIDTHWHFDHTDGNSTFAENGATLVAHKNCRTRLSQDQYIPSLEWRSPAAPRIAWPTVTFDAPVVIDLGWGNLQLVPQEPAHTDGDVAVWLPSANVLVMSDLFTNGTYPIIDESSRGSLRGMIQAIERLLPLVNAETVVILGHGPIGNRDALLSFRDMLCVIEGRIKRLIAAHSPVTEILASAPTSDFDRVWRCGYVTGGLFVRMILAGLGLSEEKRSAGWGTSFCFRSRMQIKILALSGSSRRDSLNQKLLNVAARGAHDAGAKVTPIRLLDFELPIYDGDQELDCRLPAGARAVQVLVSEHEGLLIATPEHNGGYTALLKNAIDWVTGPRGAASSDVGPIAGRLAALVFSVTRRPGWNALTDCLPHSIAESGGAGASQNIRPFGCTLCVQ